LVRHVVEAANRDARHVAEHTRLLLRELEWEAKGRDRHLLLRGREVRESMAWLRRTLAALPPPEPQVTELHWRYVEASERRDRRLSNSPGSRGGGSFAGGCNPRRRVDDLPFHGQ
jgi:hypothetical protein